MFDSLIDYGNFSILVIGYLLANFFFQNRKFKEAKEEGSVVKTGLLHLPNTVFGYLVFPILLIVLRWAYLGEPFGVVSIDSFSSEMTYVINFINWLLIGGIFVAVNFVLDVVSVIVNNIAENKEEETKRNFRIASFALYHAVLGLIVCRFSDDTILRDFGDSGLASIDNVAYYLLLLAPISAVIKEVIQALGFDDFDKESYRTESYLQGVVRVILFIGLIISGDYVSLALIIGALALLLGYRVLSEERSKSILFADLLSVAFAVLIALLRTSIVYYAVLTW